MILICINNKHTNSYGVTRQLYLTIDKAYDSTESDGYYCVKNDKGEYSYYDKYFFKDVQEIRESKLNILCGEK